LSNKTEQSQVQSRIPTSKYFYKLLDCKLTYLNSESEKPLNQPKEGSVVTSIKKDKEMITMLKDNNKLQTSVLNNLKQKLQEIERENSDLYNRNKHLEKNIGIL